MLIAQLNVCVVPSWAVVFSGCSLNSAAVAWEEDNNININKYIVVVLGSCGHNRVCASVQDADLSKGTCQTTIPILFPVVSRYYTLRYSIYG